MRTLLFFLLSLPLVAFAAEDFDKKLEELHKKLETSFMHARTKHNFESYPNDDFIHEYNNIVREHVKNELALHKEFCKEDGDKSCLSDKQIQEKKAQYRIIAGLETRKNAWAKEGITQEKEKERIAAYNACHDKNEGCDKLPIDDKEVVIETAEDIFSIDQSDTKAAEVKDSKSKAQTKAGTKSSTTTSATTTATTSQTSAKSSQSTTTTTEEDDREVSVEVSGEGAEERSSDAKDPKKVAAKKADKKTEKNGDNKDPKKEPKREVAQKDDKTDPAATSDEEIVEDDEKTPRNYKPDSCRWVNDLPRKIVNGPGCGPKGRSKICTGYVICEQKEGGAKFIRMSTCAPDKCGSSDEDAVRCTKDMGYYSMKPQGEEKLFMSPALKKILSNGSTRQ